MKRAEKSVFSDVLVVGGAGAAVMSAVRAAQKGAGVVLVSKGKVGKSGNTIMIGGGFGIDGEGAREYCGETEADQTYTKDRVFRKLVASGFYLGDQRLQKVFAEKAPAAVADCLKWAKNAGQLFAFNPKSCTWRTSGASFGRAVREGLRESPAVSVYEDVMIVDLLTNAGSVCGALGIDVYTGELIRYHAKAVILATGGYQPFSLKNSNSDMAGDGIAMALRAGAKVTDMEFLLFIGTVLEPHYARGSILPFLLTIPALSSIRPKVTDLDGKELVYPSDEKYRIKPTDSKVNKLLMAYFYGRGIFEKADTHGNVFYYDYSAYSDEEIRQGFGSFAEKQKKWHREGMYNGIDLRKLTEDIIRNQKRLKVGFGNEYSMGGVAVAPDFSTGVPGLYAAGEVTGGTFGAFRSGDGLTEMLTHGAVAGASAAAYAEKTEQLSADDLWEKEEAVFAPFEKDGGISPIEARKELERICDRGFDFFRDGERLREAYDRVSELRSSLGDLFVANRDLNYNLEWINFFLVRNLALCAEIGIYSALNRRESRGTHLRADYPEVNNREYLFNWVAKIEDGRIRYEKHRPQAPYIASPTENAPSIPEYIVKNILEDS